MKRFVMLVFVLLASLGSDLRAQVPLTNEDIPRLVAAGLSEEFILNLIAQQGSRLSSDPASLVEFRIDGVGERIVAAIVRKNPPVEPLTSGAIVEMVKAGYSEGFILDLLSWQPVRFTTNATRIIELRQAGVSERILAAMVAKTDRRLPPGTEITIRLIDPIDSEKNDEGNEFRASLDYPVRVGDTEIAPRGADARVRLITERESGKLTGRTELTVQLLSFTVDGYTVPVNTTSVTEGSGSRGARTAKTAVTVGAIGAIIGAIAGGGKGAAIGAGAGAAVGAGSQVFMKGQRVRVPSETILTFTTQETVKLP